MRTVDFGIPTAEIFLNNKKIFWHTNWHHINFPKYPYQLPHIVDILTRFLVVLINVQYPRSYA